MKKDRNNSSARFRRAQGTLMSFPFVEPLLHIFLFSRVVKIEDLLAILASSVSDINIINKYIHQYPLKPQVEVR
jgi:hypothetical protein